jgi:hypothetical protein
MRKKAEMRGPLRRPCQANTGHAPQLGIGHIWSRQRCGAQVRELKFNYLEIPFLEDLLARGALPGQTRSPRQDKCHGSPGIWPSPLPLCAALTAARSFVGDIFCSSVPFSPFRHSLPKMHALILASVALGLAAANPIPDVGPPLVDCYALRPLTGAGRNRA